MKQKFTPRNGAKTKRIALWIGVLLSITLLAQSCFFGNQEPQADKVELVIWKPFEDEANLRPIIQAYRQFRPNVTIRFVEREIVTYEQDVLNALAAGAGPDIFSIHNDWLPRYLDKLVPAPETLFTAREISDTFVDVTRTDLIDSAGRLYALPLSVDVLALYYNRDLLGSANIAQPPRSWEEVIDAVKKLTKQDRFGNFTVHGIAMGTAGNVNRATDILSLLMLQNGTQVYNVNRTQATLSADLTTADGTRYSPGAQAVEFYTQFANPAKQTYTWNSRSNYSIDAFVAGQAAMMLSYSYLANTIRERAPLLNFGVAPSPQIDLTKPKVNFANYFAEAVSRGSPNSAWAWDFIKFAVSADSLASYYGRTMLPASRKDLISQQLSSPEVGVFAEGALTARSFYKPDSARVETIFANMIDDVILRGKTPDQAVSEADQLLNQLLR